MAKGEISKLKRFQASARALWEERVQEADFHQSKLRKFVHFWVLVARSFVRNRCPLRASALAYYTLLALIPLLAVGIGVSTALFKQSENVEPIQKMISKLVEEIAPQLGLIPKTTTAEQEDARREVAGRIHSFIINIHSSTLNVTGALALILVAIGLLSNIEATFNDIWGVARGRSWFVRLIYYWAAITFGPLLILLGMGLTISSKFKDVQALVREWHVFGTFLFNITPFLILVLILMLIYLYMPNTRVHWKAALLGAVVAGLLWKWNSNFNLFFASRVVSASKVYGPLSVIPVFLIGLYFSWLIVLFGAQVSYALQNLDQYLQELQTEAVNQRGREYVALRLMSVVGQRFHRGEEPASAQQIANELAVPARLIHRLVQILISGGLLLEVAGAETRYAPGRPLDKINCHDILLALRTCHGQELPTREDATRMVVCTEFEKIQEAERHAASMTLLALISEAKSAADEKAG